MNEPKSIVPLLVAEFVGTALLLTIGLSFVIFFWGEGSPMIKLVPNEAVRRAITGFLFGCTGCAIALSKVGKISGAHINPAVSFAFWLRGKMKTRALISYMICQMAGSVAGCSLLLLWGRQGSSIYYGNTIAGDAGVKAAFIGEVITTAALITIIFVFAGRKSLRNLTPYTMPVLYSIMVCVESPLSGCSTNPARSFGPDVISRLYTNYWLYWLAPLTGVVIVIIVFKGFELYRYYRLEAARISYHHSPTHESIRTTDPALKAK